MFGIMDSQLDNFFHRSKNKPIVKSTSTFSRSCLFTFVLIIPHSRFVLFRLAPRLTRTKTPKIKNLQKYGFENYNLSTSVIFLYLYSNHASPKFECGHVVNLSLSLGDVLKWSHI